MPAKNVYRHHKYATAARKIVQNTLPKLGIILIWLGRPLFFLLTLIITSTVFLCWLVGKILILAVLDTAKLPKLPKIVFAIPRVRKPFLSFSFKVAPLKHIFIMVTFMAVALGSFWFWLLRDLPKPGQLVTRDQQITTKIYDRNRNLLYKIYRSQNRTLVPLSDIPLYVRQATIAIEDAGFYSHSGVSVKGIVRALGRNITRSELAGGSTITQQLVKNALLSPEKTLTRKLKEIVLAFQVELAFSKDQIFEMYLNEVGYGGAAYGIEEASQLYFGKPARELTLAEGALIAGLPQAPTTYSPFGANPQFARTRQLEVLARMVHEGYIAQQQMEEASGEQLVFAPQKTDIKAPHFVMYVKQLLAQEYGERMVEEGGLEVTTSLDLGIQEMAEKVVWEETEKIRGLRISNGAAMVTDPKTGEVLAMVGSKNYFESRIDGNFNVTTALRQPGSSIKPVNYAYALESGRYTPASTIPDTPITYNIAGSEPYAPRNYDNRFHGNVPLRTALGSSFNVPAVKVLASYGVVQMIEQGRKMGITTWENPSNYGLSLTLGGGEVKMVDMAVVYATLANYGQRVDLQPILKVTDYRGRVLEENDCLELLANDCGQQVLDPHVAFILTDILYDNNARTPAFGPNSLLNIPNHKEVAVKTGTTQNLRDNWAIGYTQNYVVAAWVGNNDNTPMAYVASGVTGATPIWHKVMASLLENQPNHPWEEPEGLVKTNICSITGTLPCEGCPTRTEYFLSGTEPKYHCSSEQIKEKLEKEKKETTSQESPSD